jgi:hypothetical protein
MPLVLPILLVLIYVGARLLHRACSVNRVHYRPMQHHLFWWTVCTLVGHQRKKPEYAYEWVECERCGTQWYSMPSNGAPYED